MFPSRAKREKRAQEQRRHEVKQLLSEAGFGPRGLTIFGTAPSDSDRREAIMRLRDTLQALGPLFASFGLYLASRPDLFSLSDCLVLGEIPNRAPPAPAELVRQIVEMEPHLNAEEDSSAQRLGKLDPEPFESRLLFQLHYGELTAGEPVVVKVIHPRTRRPDDVELLPLLASAVVPRLSDAEQFASVVADFRRALVDAVDCRRVAESLELLSHDARETGRWTVPKVYAHLCTEDVLVTERLDGIRLDRHLAGRREQLDPPSDSSSGDKRIVSDELARRLCDAFLRQTFDGTLLAVDIRPENVLIRSSTELAILDGTFVTLPRASRENLLNYFVANAGDEPSQALPALLKELDAGNRRISDSTLDRLFRQVVAFRDGGWDDGGHANCLSDTLFAQWRLAAANGYRPLRHLTDMYRGTFHVAAIARQLAPQRDSLLEGVKDLRLTKLMQDIGTMMQPGYWGGQADRMAALLMLGPRHLDEALKSFVSQQVSKEESRPARRPSAAPWSLVLSVLLILAGFTLFREPLGAGLSAEWSERLLTFVFLALGGLNLSLLTAPADV